MTSWDYAQLSHLAKELGGPQALITNIRNGGIATGRWQGGVIGTVATLTIGGVGLYLYDKHQKKLALANESAAALESGIKAHDVIHSEETSEDEGDEPNTRNEKPEIKDREGR